MPKTVDRVMACLSSDPPLSRVLLRKASRIAGRLNSDWYCVYVQTPGGAAGPHRHHDAAASCNIQLAQSLGAEVVKLEAEDVVYGLINFARARDVTLLIIGQPRRHSLLPWRRSVADMLVHNDAGIDVLVVPAEETAR